jgi:hypothetical protein
MNTPWHWMIAHPMNLSNAKDMGLTDPSGNVLSAPVPLVYDIDAEVNTAAIVAALHAQGKRVIGYIDAGTWEDWRSDASSFPASVKGNKVAGWPGENWLDVRQIAILQPIMRARMQVCKDKGFDAIEPDNIDGYSNNTGFPITYQQQLDYNRMLASTAHSMSMSILLKNDVGQASDLVNDFDFALNEECAAYNECGTLDVFTAAGKAVFQAEYSGSLTSFCPAANAANRNAVKFPLNLDGGRQPCR